MATESLIILPFGRINSFIEDEGGLKNLLILDQKETEIGEEGVTHQ
jgi:hypothetical protein